MQSQSSQDSRHPNVSPQMTSVEETARAIFKAYEDKDLDAAQRLIADDFSFTSPLDNKLNRESYFKICWANCQTIDKFDFKELVVKNDKAFVTYEAHTKKKSFRNTEVLTVEDAKITSVEVYFGWNIPHEAPEGKHRDQKT